MVLIAQIAEPPSPEPINSPALAKLEQFFSRYTSQTYDKGERILRENETPSGIYLIKEGIVRTYLISEQGTEFTAFMKKANAIFPLRWAVDLQPNVHNYQAMTAVILWRAPREAFLAFLQQNSDVLMELVSHLSFEVSALIYRMQHLVFGNAQAKVASVVLTAARRFGDGGVGKITVQVPLTHQQIADSAGISRETASLEMKKLKEEGIISYKGRTIVIHDPDRLSQVCFL